MKRIILIAFILFFGVVKPKAQTNQETVLTVHEMPIKLTFFGGHFSNDKINLSWTVDDNPEANRFELERSLDGIVFKMACMVFASEKNGVEQYAFAEPAKNTKKIFYRLKVFDKNNNSSYSETLLVTL